MRMRNRWMGSPRATAMVAAGAAVLGMVGSSWADVKASRKCRGEIAKALSNVVNAGYADVASCHKAADKAAQPSGDCNVVTSAAFDPKGKYAGAKSKAATGIGKACLAGDPVLDNYQGMDVTGATEPVIDETVGGSSILVVGGLNLNGDKAKKKCVETIAKSQAAIVKEILKNSTKCQAGLDKTATLFGPLAPTCLDAGAKSSAKATTNIQKACGSLTGPDVGTCTPLPACAVSGSVTAGQSLAKTLYQQLPPPTGQVCGNGVVEGAEQCDDGTANGTPGDPCSTSCESLAETCGPGTPAGGSIIGHRVVTVSLNIPGGQKLAGVQVGFDYPQLEASIKGTGASSVVQGAVQVLQSTPTMLTLANDTDTDFSFVIAGSANFIQSGPLFSVPLDECVPNSVGICNRAQNVIGCCPAADLDACTANPSDPVACFCGASGSVTGAQCAAASCTTGACSSASGGLLDQTTCEACPDLPGCMTVFNPPVCANGHFPLTAVGPCDNRVGACPSDNVCVSQDLQVKKSCTVTDPVDALAQPVAGVTCSIAITETP
jgi:cysteine-rich repeat protein